MGRQFSAKMLSCACAAVLVQRYCQAGVTLNEVQNFTTTGNITSALYSSQYNTLILRDSTSDIRILNATTGAQISLKTPSATGAFTDFGISPSGRYLFAADYGGTVIGYDQPSNPSFIDRYDLQTGTWTSAQAPAIAYRIAPVDDTHVLALGEDQWVDMTMNTYSPGSMTQLSRITPGYEGSMRYSSSLNRVIYNESGISSTSINAFNLSGSTLTSAEGTSGSAYGGYYGLLSTDGLDYYYGQKELNAANLNQAVATFSEAITAAGPTIAFGSAHYYDATSGTVLGAVSYTPVTWTVGSTGRDAWGIQQTSSGAYTVHHYVTAQGYNWNSSTGGSWSSASSWNPNTLPDGMDNTADFSQVTLAADSAISLDGNHTIGHLISGDLGASHNWTINPGSGGVLTLQVTGGIPNITVSSMTTTINVPIAGTQGLLKDGQGTLVLGVANTYTGGTTINAGTLSINADNELDSGLLSINAGTFRAQANISSMRSIALQNASSGISVDTGFTYSALAGSTISGTGGLTKLGNGTLDLSAATVSYTGTTTVNAGLLNVNTFASTAQITVGAVGTMNVSGAGLTLGPVADSGSVNFTATTGTVTLGTLSGSGTTTFASGATIPTLSSGTINVAGVANITTATAGTANFNGPSALISTLSNTAVTLTGTPLSVGAGTQTGGGITGTGSVIKNTTGTLILGFTNTYSGGTNISAGTLQIGNGGTVGSIAGDVIDNGSLIFNRSDSITFAGLISGSGSVRQAGLGTLTLTNSNTYTGGTNISSGTILINADNELGSGPVSIVSGTLRTTAGISSARSIALLSTTSAIQVDASIYSALTGSTVSGTGGLTKLGGGTLDLSAAAVSYTGATNVSAGLLNLNSFASTAQVTVAVGASMNVSGANLTLGPVADSGSVNFTATTGTVTLGTLSGSGTTTFASGATIPTLSSGTINVAGVANITTATAGTANFNGPSALISTLSNTAVTLTGTPLSVGAGTQTGGGITGTGSVIKNTTGTLILGFTNTYSGGTNISAGTLQIGNGGTAGSIAGDVIDNGSLIFNRSDSITFTGLISGSGSVRQAGLGTLTLTNSNTYTGGTNISSGTLQLGDGINAGTVVGNVTDNGVLLFNTPAAGQTFAGSVSGTGGISKLGSGTQVLTGNDTNTGGTVVSAGVLQIGNGTTIGTITGNVTDNAALVFDHSDDVTFSGAITGSGRVEQAGTGTLYLSANLNNALKSSSGRIVINATSTISGDVTTTATGRIDNSGTLHTGNFDNGGVFSGTTDVSGSFVNRSTGDIRLAAGQSLLVQSSSTETNSGLLEVLGNATSEASFEGEGAFVNAAGGSSLIAGRNASLRFDNGLTNQGSLSLSYGINDVFGDVNNAGGSISIAGGAGVTFYDDVVQNGSLSVSAVGGTRSSAVFLGSFSGSGGFTGGGDVFIMGDLRPGNSPAEVDYVGNLYLGPDSDTIMQLGGLQAGTQADKVDVSGSLGLSGELSVVLYNGFSPAVGDSFDLFDAGSITGNFTSISLPALPTGSWDIDQLYTTGKISIVPEPAALSSLSLAAMTLLGRRRKPNGLKF